MSEIAPARTLRNERLPRRLVSRRTIERAAKLSGIALAALIVFGLLVAYTTSYAAGRVGAARSDFIPIYAAAELAARHSPYLYDLPHLYHAEVILVGTGRLPYGALPYLYPPWFAGALAPLTLLPFGAAFWAWALVNFLCLMAAAVWTVCRVAHSPLNRLFLTMVILSSVPAFSGIAWGQVSAILTLGTLAGVVALSRGRDLMGGILLAVLTIKLPYIAPIFLVLLAARRYRAAGAMAATSAVLGLASSVLVNTGSAWAYILTMVNASQWHSRHIGFGAITNNGWDGFWNLLLPAHEAIVPWAVLSVAYLAGLAVAARRRGAEPQLLGLAVLGSLLISPHVLTHDFLLLLVTVTTTYHASRRLPRHEALAWLLVYGTAVLGLVRWGPPFQWPALALTLLASTLWWRYRREVTVNRLRVAESVAVA